MPRQILRVTPETTPGVFNSAGVKTLIDLPSDNAFTMRVDPKFWEIASFATDNNIIQTGTAVADIDGSLSLLCRPGNAALLASMIANATGACPDLPSFTFDHGIIPEDGTCSMQYRRYLGVKCDGGFSLSNSGQGVLMMFNLKLMALTAAAISSTDFPLPAVTSYNFAESPFTFEMVAGTALYGGVDISQYLESLSYDAGNMIMPFRGAGRYRSFLSYRGHRPKITLGLLYYSQQFRTDFEANTAKALNLTFTSGVHTLNINFGTTNLIRTVNDDLKMGDLFRLSVQLQNVVDPTTGNDMSITYTP
jgi:hypothetical protein